MHAHAGSLEPEATGVLAAEWSVATGSDTCGHCLSRRRGFGDKGFLVRGTKAPVTALGTGTLAREDPSRASLASPAESAPAWSIEVNQATLACPCYNAGGHSCINHEDASY